MSNERTKHLDFDLAEASPDFYSRGYRTVSCTDDEGQTAYIVTNASGEGLWERCETPMGVEYRQVLGTCQFRLASTEAALKRQLRRAHDRIFGW